MVSPKRLQTVMGHASINTTRAGGVANNAPART
jgi:hypothetical protein